MVQSVPVDPGVALFIFLILSLALAAAFWPGVGIAARVRRILRSTERIRLEDALKHMYACEYASREATLESLAGILGTSRIVAARTLRRLAELRFAVPDGDSARLTDGGREYALRILRTHRLWERYLADRTGVKSSQWHASAEEAEHTLTAAEVDRLAARLGHPLYDPHGDPIPTGDGHMPPLAGVPLSALTEGEAAEITHLEDEPPEVFQDLVALGLSPHQRLVVLQSGVDGVRIRVAGKERFLDPLAAANVTARRLGPEEQVPESTHSLADARPGETVTVVGISPTCRGTQRRRLLDLGVVPGTEITAELVSTGGDPVAYRIRGALIALRREQARWIQIAPSPVPVEA